MTTPPQSDLLLMAEIAGAHGVKGGVKLKTFGDDPGALVDYPPLIDTKTGKTYQIDTMAPHGQIWLATIEGVEDRTAAEKLFGLKLYLPRAELPKIKKKDTYYHADLIGMTAKLKDGAALGTVVTVANFGAGDLIEVKPVKGATFYVPFTKAVVTDVDIDARMLTVDPPPGLLE
jgi:16S rRNA processing protein RimM